MKKTFGHRASVVLGSVAAVAACATFVSAQTVLVTGGNSGSTTAARASQCGCGGGNSRQVCYACCTNQYYAQTDVLDQDFLSTCYTRCAVESRSQGCRTTASRYLPLPLD